MRATLRLVVLALAAAAAATTAAADTTLVRVRVSPAEPAAGLPVQLEYRGDVEVLDNGTSTESREEPAEWSLPDGDEGCALSGVNTTLGTAELLCDTAGARVLRLTRGAGAATSDHVVTLGAAAGCHEWAAELAEAGGDAVDTLPPNAAAGAHELRVRVAADTDEEARVRSRQFFRLGERPLATPAPGSGVLAAGAEWDDDASLWRVALSTLAPEAAVLSLTGKGVSVLGCGVRDRRVAAPVRRFEAPPGWASEALAGEADGASFEVVRDPCSPNVAVLRRDQDAWLVQAGLDPHPAEALRVPGLVDGAALAGGALAVLRPGGAVERLAAGAEDDGLVAAGEGLPAAAAARLAGSGACDVLRTVNNGTSPLAGWLAAWNATAAYVSADGGATFVELPLPDALDGSVEAVVRLVGTPSTVVLAGRAVEVRDEASGEWRRGHEFDAAAGVASLAQHPGGSGELLAYGGEGGLHYGPDAGACFFPVAARPELLPGEAVDRVAFDGLAAGFVAATSLGRLFLGAAGLPEAVELPSGGGLPSGAAAAAPAYALPGVPAAVRLAGQHAPAVPSDLAASDAVAACPYEGRDGLASTPGHGAVYLDMNERVEFTLDLFVPSGSANSFSASASDPARLGFSTGTSAAVSGGLVRHRRVLTLRESPSGLDAADRATRLAEAQGSASLRVAPVQGSLACAGADGRNHAETARVRVGCPPGRHLRVRGAAGEECGQVRLVGGQSAAETLAELGLDDEEYSSAVFGCAFSVYHQSTGGFRPSVELWDGDALVGDMPADFVLRETRGRGGFTYNATNGEMGCERRPMTWSEAAWLAERDGIPLDEAWTPFSHRGCHDADDSEVPEGFEYSAGGTYQVLNATNLNYIHFSPTGRDGLFLFKLRVVDPAYSYCELETYFALDVFGAPMPLSEAMTIVGIATAAVILVLVATYVYYRHEMRMKRD